VLEKPFRVQQLLKMVEAAMETRQETVLPSDAPNH
jgi:FixJ family two-component response regulator